MKISQGLKQYGMPKIKDISGVAAIMLAGAFSFWSCSDKVIDEPVNPDNPGNITQGTGELKSFLLAINIDVITNGGSSTRTTYTDDDADQGVDGDYVYGSDSENALSSDGHFLLFFDGKNQLQINYPITFPNKEDMKPGQGEGNKIEKRYWTLIKDIKKEDLPKSVLAVLNGGGIKETIERLAIGTTMEEVLGLLWENSDNPYNIGYDLGHHFVMTNSTYYDGTGAIVKAVPITEKMYHELEDQYQPIPPDINLPLDEILMIKVERMLAKVTLEIDKDGITQNSEGFITFPEHPAIICAQIDDDGNAHNVYGDWRVTITGWNMNGLENSAYLFKQIGESTPYTDWGENWKDPDYYRTYWAIDKNYNDGYYPDQYREAIDVDLNSYEKDNKGSSQTPSLNYRSFQQIKQDGMGSPINHISYIPENTYDYTKLTNSSLTEDRIDMIAGTHLLICGRLEIKADNDNNWIIGGQEKEDGGLQDFYRGEFGIFYKNWRECFWGVVRRFNNTLNSQTKMRYHLYNWDNKETLESRSTYEALTTSHPSYGSSTNKQYQLCLNGVPIDWEMVKGWGENMKDDVFIKALINGGDGKLITWIDGMSIIDINDKNPETQKLRIYSKIYENQDEDGKDITPDDDNYNYLDDQNKDRKLRPCTDNDVKSLLLEYLGPVDHYALGNMYYAAPVKINDNVKGVVRNAWYKYVLKDIISLGTSVDDLTQPIIPDKQYTHDQTNLIFEVIDWHEFNFTAPILP